MVQSANNSAEDIFEVEKILDSRKKGSKIQYLVKWEGYSCDHNTWEDEENIFAKQYIEEYLKTKLDDVKNNKKRRSTQTLKKKTNDCISENENVDTRKRKNVVEDKIINEHDKLVLNKRNEKSGLNKSALESIEEIKQYSNNKNVGKENVMHDGSEVFEISEIYKKLMMEFEKENVNTKKNISNSFDVIIEKILDVFYSDDDLYASAKLVNGNNGTFHTKFLHARAPLKLLEFYESKIVFKSSVDEDSNIKI